MHVYAKRETPINQSINQMVYFVLQRKCWIKIQETLLNTHIYKYKTSKKVVSIFKQESPAVVDKPARRLRKVCTLYVRAVGL